MTMDTQTKVKPTFGYYRQPDGWITASPSTDTDELKYRRDGWLPLKQYGSFEMSTPYMAAHPLEPLFMRGGAHELTEDQIRKQGLYLDPPMVPGCKTPLGQEHKHHAPSCIASASAVVFPQLASMADLGPFPCLFDCGRMLPTIEARNQHASVMHAPEKSDERTGESLAAALASALLNGFGGTRPVEHAAAEIAHEPDMTAQVAELLISQQQAIEVLRGELEAMKTAQSPVARKRRRKKAAA